MSAKKAPKLHAFLAAIAVMPSVTRAAAAAGIHRSFHYSRYEKDPAYKVAFDRAWAMGIQALEDDAVDKAMIGYEEPVVYQGQFTFLPLRNEAGELVLDKEGNVVVSKDPLTVRRPNPALLQFLLRGAKPEKYRERFQHDGTLNLNVTKFKGSLEELLATYRNLVSQENDTQAA